jgi:hypothetical protein
MGVIHKVQKPKKMPGFLIEKCGPQHPGDSRALVVERWAKDCDHEVGEVRGAFVELKVAYHAVVAEIFCYARFRDAEMFGETRLDRLRSSVTPGASQKAADGQAQCLASLNIIVRGEIGVA